MGLALGMEIGQVTHWGAYDLAYTMARADPLLKRLEFEPSKNSILAFQKNGLYRTNKPRLGPKFGK